MRDPEFSISYKKKLKRTKTKTFVFAVTKGCFNFYLIHFLMSCSSFTSFLLSIVFTLLLNSKKAKACSVCCKSPVVKTRLGLLALSHVILWTSRVYREARLEYIESRFCNSSKQFILNLADLPIAERTSWKKELFLLITFRFC